jgi:tetratricopeptide (TPR) repeat protein
MLELLWHCSQQHVAAKRYVEALPQLDDLIQLAPTKADAYQQRALVHHALGQGNQAIADWTTYNRLTSSGTAIDYANRGAAKNSVGCYEEAIADYSEAIRLNPQFAIAYHNRGFAKNSVGRYEEAIRLDPQFAIAYANRGAAKNSVRRYEEAIADYSEAIRLDPQFAIAYYNRGYTYYCLQNDEAAWIDYQTALRLKPDAVRALLFTGLALAQGRGTVQDLSAAQEHWQRGVLCRSPENVPDLNYLSNL